MAIKHATVVTVPNNPNKQVSATAWNNEHVIEDSTISNSHIDASAGISESKLSLNFPTHSPYSDPTFMGIYVGTSEPALKTYAQWLSSHTGYWAWIDISGGLTGVTATVSSMNADGAITPLTAEFTRYVTATINPASAIADFTALIANFSGENITGAVTSANADGMISALTAAYIIYVTATVGAGNADGAIAPLTATASGGAVEFFDNFNRTAGNLGSNWTDIAAGLQTANQAFGAGSAYYNGATYDANMFAEFTPGASGSWSCEVRVRLSDDGNNYYALNWSLDTDAGAASLLVIKRSGGGSRTVLGADFGDMAGYFRIEASGGSPTTLTVKYKASVGDSWTTLGTRTDSTSPITSGGRGGIMIDHLYQINLDDFRVGNL